MPDEIGIDGFQADRAPDKRYQDLAVERTVVTSKGWVLPRWSLCHPQRRC